MFSLTSFEVTFGWVHATQADIYADIEAAFQSPAGVPAIPTVKDS
jgi:hypothetical protein